MDREVFRYSYSGKKNSEILEIRKKYQNFINLTNNYYNSKKEVNIMNKNDKDFLVQKIRTQYTEKEHTEIDSLKELDCKVKRPANIFAYIFGSLSAIIMGSGMSLVMTDIGSTIGLESPMIPGIAIGVFGMLMAIINYPIYKGILGSRRRKYADRIISLSDRIMKG